jgi:hypothetical protein
VLGVVVAQVAHGDQLDVAERDVVQFLEAEDAASAYPLQLTRAIGICSMRRYIRK